MLVLEVALHVVAECQKQGGNCVFIDAEHALDPAYAKNIGVDLEKLIISQPDNGEQVDVYLRRRHQWPDLIKGVSYGDTNVGSGYRGDPGQIWSNQRGSGGQCCCFDPTSRTRRRYGRPSYCSASTLDEPSAKKAHRIDFQNQVLGHFHQPGDTLNTEIFYSCGF